MAEVNLGNIRGPKGEKGDKGDTGAQGPQGETGATGAKGEKGDPFTVKKTYASIEAMNADFSGTDTSEGDFVMIVSNVEDEDNAKLYVKGADSFTFISDLSGSQGMKGDKGDTGDTGATGATGPAGTDGEDGVGIASIVKSSTAGIVDTYTINFTDDSTSTFSVTNGEKGEKGDKGDKGDTGDTGPAGADGKTPSLRIDSEGNLWADYPD